MANHQKTSFESWKVGTVLSNNLVITTIFGKTSKYILYSTNKSYKASFRCSEVPNEQFLKAQNYHLEVLNLIDCIPIHHLRKQLYFSANSILARVFDRDGVSDDELCSVFKALKQTIKQTEQNTKKVYTTNSNYSVYLTSDSYIRTKVSQATDEQKTFGSAHDLSESNYRAKILESQAKDNLQGKDLFAALDMIGHALSFCYRQVWSGNKLCLDRAFNDSILFIEANRAAQLRLKFILSLLLFTVFFGVLLLSFTYEFQAQKMFFIGMIAALGGSFVSILQRHNNITITPYMSATLVGIESFTRLCVGMCFGLVAILLSYSELALAPFKDLDYALAVFSFFSGFSERFIPSILDQVTTQLENKKAI
ncbi:hypothetical protein [Vibrio crassostreae]|uniref:hypothetical protein n=1 Tax=Vibrio crassostreae TaxID=246167 RepID=UPI0010470772|nr:hypothetical protein [Vibrio crassostreae]TCV16657.1 hypothetical protein EDB16_10162 [Vibrio crassostreae]TWD66095.1 hypothetical protein FB444_10578 [Vibrio crassostreae]